jgi:hypothetical protein
LIKELHSPEPPDAHNTTNAHNTANTPNTTNTHNTANTPNTATPVPDRNTPGLYKKHAMPQQRSSQLPQCRGIGRQDRNNNKQQMVAECVGLSPEKLDKKIKYIIEYKSTKTKEKTKSNSNSQSQYSVRVKSSV